MNRALLFLLLNFFFFSCSKREPIYSVICDFSTNIQNEDDLKLLVEKRLVVLDSIDYRLKLKDNRCVVEVYSKVDTSLLQKMLKNQLADGYYHVYRSSNFFNTLENINHELGELARKEVDENLKNKSNGYSSTLLDKVKSKDDSIAMRNRHFEVTNPLFMQLIPRVNNYDFANDYKSIGVVNINNLTTVYSLLSRSGLVPDSTIFIIGHASTERHRDLYAINLTRGYDDDFIMRSKSKSFIMVFNNKVMESGNDILEMTRGKYNPDFDLSEEEVAKCASLFSQKKFLNIERVQITAHSLR